MPKYKVYFSAWCKFSRVMEGKDMYDEKMLGYIDDNLPIDPPTVLEEWCDEQIDAVIEEGEDEVEEWEFYCYANHELFTGYDSCLDAEEGIARLITEHGFEVDDFDEPRKTKYTW
jgi:hypothetical protein